jgi:hypothetical protein
MTAAAVDNGLCQSCPDPKGGYTCYACLQLHELDTRDEVIERVRAWVLRRCTVAPGITNEQKRILDELIADLEQP